MINITSSSNTNMISAYIIYQIMEENKILKSPCPRVKDRAPFLVLIRTFPSRCAPSSIRNPPSRWKPVRILPSAWSTVQSRGQENLPFPSTSIFLEFIVTEKQIPGSSNVNKLFEAANRTISQNRRKRVVQSLSVLYYGILWLERIFLHHAHGH